MKAENERLIADNTALEIWNEFYTVEYEVLQSEKENLMRTLEEGAEEIESARKETTKEILQDLYNYPHEYHEKRIIELAKQYGMEVEE